MNTLSPRFTIIVPVYNGQNYIQTCVESILQQTFPDFELIILHNRSTDNTRSLIQQYQDKRIRIIESDVYLGIAENFRRALAIPKGEFMTYFGHDDGMMPNYLETMDKLIRQEPTASLYHAHFQFVDIEGKVLSTSRPMPRTENASEYLEALFSRQRDSYGSGYIMRSDLHDKIGGMPNYPNLFFADDVLWIESMRQSYKACAEDVCFFCRQHSNLSAQPKHWNAWLDAMEEYVPFLFHVARDDAAFDEVLRNDGGRYFSDIISAVYLNALHDANQSNQRVSPAIEQKIRRTFADLTDALLPLSRFDVRSRKMINANPVLRNLLLGYKRLPHG